MLEILTLTRETTKAFDRAVNEALMDGWELVKRECFITGSDRAATFYAELERIIDEPEEDGVEYSIGAQWHITRNPRSPYKCSACGYATKDPWPVCPECGKEMRLEAE